MNDRDKTREQLFSELKELRRQIAQSKSTKTKGRTVEEELSEAQTFESVKILAGGIANTFNNILMTILGNISLLKLEADRDSENFRVLSDIETACEQAHHLTRQLLTISKGEMMAKVPVKDRKKEVEGEELEASLIFGQGRILFMDDEELLRKVTVRMIKRLGYDIECASEGSEAITKYVDAIKAGRFFDIVILDLIVPGGLGAIKTLEKLKELDPRVKAIVASGYSTDRLMSEFHKHGFCGIISKPCNMKALSDILHETMKRK